MPASEWAGAPYVRIYSTLARDHRKVWRDDRLLATYVRLLMGADAAWPGPAALPHGIDLDVVEALVADEVIDVEDGLYLFHGLDDERKSRAKRGQIGGFVRAGMADRDTLGRFAGHTLDPSSTNGAAPSVVNSVESSARSSGSPASPPARPPSKGGAGERSTPARASAPAREGPSPTQIYCEDYSAHRSDHQWWAGIGWKCNVCERAKAETEPTFREKVARHTPEDQPF